MNFAHAVLRQPARSGIRTRLMLVLSMSLVLAGLLPAPAQAGWLATTWPAYDASSRSEAARVLELAREQLGKPFVMGGVGPNVFDCSGLVWFVFKQNGLADRMGGKRRGATGYLNWFKNNLPNQVSHNLADARPGDILIWGGGKHSGLFIGDKWAISALNPRYDIRVHRADRVGLTFTAVLMVRMSRTDDGSTPTPSPTPSPTQSPTPSPTPTASPSASPTATPET